MTFNRHRIKEAKEVNKVFISYVSENIEIVDRLYHELKSYGIQVWLDRKDLAPGLRWKREIRRAIQQGAFFIACFSEEYNARDRTYMNEELTIAIEELSQRPVDQAWFIPVKLNECEIPDRGIGGGETLRDLQYVNLYENWDVNLQRILEIVQTASSGTINTNTVEQSVDPNAVTEFVKGLTYQNRRNYERAVEYYTKALRLNPQLIGAYNNRGNVYNSMGEHDCAIKDFTKAIQLRPDFADAYNNRGNAYDKKGNSDWAIKDFTKAIQLKSDLVEGYYNLGRIYHNSGDLNRAIGEYTKAINLKPDYIEAYYNRGLAYHNSGDPDPAIGEYSKAINLNPNYAIAYNNRGVAYYSKGNHEKAIVDFNRAIDLRPDNAKTYYGRGDAYSDTGEFDKAIKDYNRAIELIPEFAVVYYKRSETLLHLKEWERAKSDLTEASDMGVNIMALFQNNYGGVPDFERKNGVKLPADIATMLTPQ